MKKVFEITANNNCNLSADGLETLLNRDVDGHEHKVTELNQSCKGCKVSISTAIEITNKCPLCARYKDKPDFFEQDIPKPTLCPTCKQELKPIADVASIGKTSESQPIDYTTSNQPQKDIASGKITLT